MVLILRSDLDVALDAEVEGLVPFRCAAVGHGLSAVGAHRRRGKLQDHIAV